MATKIDLQTKYDSPLFLKDENLKKVKEQLEYILEISDMNSLDFAKNALFSEEIKANNLVENYKDDIEYIDDVVKENNRKKNAEDEKAQRILNLYNGYKYVLKSEEITKDTLKKLYNILSRHLLSEYDLSHMGDYYRNEMVYIYTSDNVAKKPDEGMDTKKVDECMRLLLEYINTDNHLDCFTDYYIKSQIIHYYFVYVHPYFDVNGRTSRTLAIWYLLNNMIYPYIIFNRGITYDKNKYYKCISNAKRGGNITLFIEYMLENVKNELIKEYGIMEIEKEKELSNLERQCINYIMSMNGNMTTIDFATTYNRFNDKRKNSDIVNNVINPLIEKEIIIPGRPTKKQGNYFFSLNDDMLKDYNALTRKLK